MSKAKAKIVAIEDIVKIVKHMVKLPDAKVDFNDASMCILNEIVNSRVSVNYGPNFKGFENKHVSAAWNRLVALYPSFNYPDGKGKAGKIEMCYRAIDLIEAIKNA